MSKRNRDGWLTEENKIKQGPADKFLEILLLRGPHRPALPFLPRCWLLLLAQLTCVMKSRSRTQWCFFPGPTLMRTLLLMQTNTTLHNLRRLFIFQLAGTWQYILCGFTNQGTAQLITFPKKSSWQR